MSMPLSSGLTNYYPPIYTNSIESQQPVEVPNGFTVQGVPVVLQSDAASGGSYTTPSNVTATPANNVTSVSLAKVRLIQNGADATLDGQAIVQGTAPNTPSTAFSLSLPNRTTVFPDTLSVRGYVGGKDSSLNGINNGVVYSVKNDTKATVAFTMGNNSAPYYVDFTVKYTIA